MYQIIYADPPWSYRDSAADGKRGAGFKYPVMRFDDICVYLSGIWLTLNPACSLCGGYRLSPKRRWQS
jgi:hypothetical protein